MADFFEQICKVLAENAAEHPGQLTDNENIAAFFRDVPPPAPPQTIPTEIPAPTVTEKMASAKSTAKNICAASLAELSAEMQHCQNCPLAAGRKNIVFGEGNPQARLMFIGEGPGYEEDLSGRPFVGKAGQLLNKMIAAMQFSREEVYIANVVKCRPQNNRNPMPEEIDKCIGFLHRQIELIRPEVIVCLGATAAKALIDTNEGITKLRGKWCSFHNIPVLPTFHPAYLLRQESAKRDAWADLQKVMKVFNKKYEPKKNR